MNASIMVVKPIRVIQANVNKCEASQKELLDHFHSKDYSIALISEPFVGNRIDVRPIQGVDVFQFSTTTRVKACIFIKKNSLDALGITQFSTPNLSVIKLKINQRPVFIASAYIEPDADNINTKDAINKLLHETRGHQIIIGGDLNGRNQLWGCEDSDLRGEDIAVLASGYNLDVCNIGETPTFEAIRHGVYCSSIVDVTLASDIIFESIKDWRVDGSICPTSDHNAIEFSIETDRRRSQMKRASTYLFNNKIADWAKFDVALTEEIEKSSLLNEDVSDADNQKLDTIIDMMTDVIRKACFASIKLRGAAKPYNPWWSHALERLKRCVVRLHHRVSDRKARRLDITQDVANLKHAKDAYAKAIRKASTNNFRQFCNRQGKEDVWSLTNRLIKDAPTQRPPVTLKCGAHFTTSSQETADALLNHFFPDDIPDTNRKQTELRQKMTQTPDTEDDVQFTSDEVIDCLKTMNPNRAPGVDNLTSNICLHFTRKYASFLTSIFNRCLSIGHFPTPWKIAQVKILPKPNKTDSSDLASYRPIGLLPIFGKVLENFL